MGPTTQRLDRLRTLAENHGLTLAISSVLLATMAFFPLRPFLGGEQWGWPYLLVVGLVASSSGVWQAVLTAILAFLVWNFVFIQPYYTFHVDRTGDLVHLLAFLVVATAVGLQTGRMRETSDAARRRASRNAALYRLSSDMVRRISPEEMALRVDAEVATLVGSTGVTIWLRPDEGADVLTPLPSTSASNIDAAAYRTARRALQSEDVDPIAESGSTFFRLSTTAGDEGVLQIRASDGLEEEDRLFAESVAHVVAVYLENLHMSQVAMRASAAQEAERLRSALISSVSHELKTPVASLTATVTDLLGRQDEPQPAELRENLDAMVDDLSRLDRSIGNLLEASRLEARAWKPSPVRFEAGELVGFVANQLSRELRKRLKFMVPDGVPLIRADFAQVARALGHLLDNALQYSSDEVTVGADPTGVGLVRVWVADAGPGILAQERTRVFERFYRGSAGRGSRSSTGLGLSLAREIVVSNGGRIDVEDVIPTGVRFVMTLPAAAPSLAETPSRVSDVPQRDSDTCSAEGTAS